MMPKPVGIIRLPAAASTGSRPKGGFIKGNIMSVLPILQRDSNRGVCISNDALPVFYMSDYSVLGLLVANLKRTRQVLADHKFAVIEKSDHLEVNIDRVAQMPEIAALLDRNGIECGLSDIIDQVYQG